MKKARESISKPEIKQVVVENWREAEDLIDPRTRRKPILEKHPGKVVEFWLDSGIDQPLALMYRVDEQPDFEPKRPKRRF